MKHHLHPFDSMPAKHRPGTLTKAGWRRLLDAQRRLARPRGVTVTVLEQDRWVELVRRPRPARPTDGPVAGR